MAKKKEDSKTENNEIVGLLTTAVVRSKVAGRGNKKQRVHIIDMKIVASEPSDVMYKLEAYLDQVISIKVDKKQLSFGDKI